MLDQRNAASRAIKGISDRIDVSGRKSLDRVQLLPGAKVRAGDYGPDGTVEMLDLRKASGRSLSDRPDICGRENRELVHSARLGHGYFRPSGSVKVQSGGIGQGSRPNIAFRVRRKGPNRSDVSRGDKFKRYRSCSRGAVTRQLLSVGHQS